MRLELQIVAALGNLNADANDGNAVLGARGNRRLIGRPGHTLYGHATSGQHMHGLPESTRDVLWLDLESRAHRQLNPVEADRPDKCSELGKRDRLPWLGKKLEGPMPAAHCRPPLL